MAQPSSSATIGVSPLQCRGLKVVAQGYATLSPVRMSSEPRLGLLEHRYQTIVCHCGGRILLRRSLGKPDLRVHVSTRPDLTLDPSLRTEQERREVQGSPHPTQNTTRANPQATRRDYHMTH